MANVDVTITLIDAHVDLLASMLAISPPGDLNGARLNLVDGGTGTMIPVQNITLP